MTQADLPSGLKGLPSLGFSRKEAPSTAPRETLRTTVYGVGSMDTVIKEFLKREVSLRGSK